MDFELEKTQKTYVFHEDAGHGWLAVKRAELVTLGLLEKISGCSYEKGNTVYLEEDCDASLFIEAMRNKGFELTIRRSYREHSHIRNYPYFQPF